MPQFILNKPCYNSHPFYGLNDFAKGYVEAMFFTNGDTGDDENENRLNELGVERLTRASVKAIKKYCDAFRSQIMPDGCTVQQWLDRIPDYDDGRAGNDLWFTAQGHGVGYWERDEIPDDTGEALSQAAKRAGEVYSVFVQRGWIHYD